MSRLPRWMQLGLVFALLGVLAAGVTFYRNQAAAHRRHAEGELTAIAELKVAQIANWRHERLGDAAVLQGSLYFGEGAARYIADRQTEDAAFILQQFESLQASYGYAEILLVDAQGAILLQMSDPPESYDGYLPTFKSALEQRRPLIVDLHAHNAQHKPHLSVIVPLYEYAHAGAEAVGAVVLICDASEFLYPLIQSWPVPSDTAETLLVRREGDSVLYLNDLRHRQGTALVYAIPLSQTQVPAVQAVLGYEGVFSGDDYRGVPVVSVVMPVPDSPWFIVAKEDTAEVLAAWRHESLLMMGVLAALIGLLLALGWATWQRGERDNYRRLYQTEAALRASVERQAITLRAIGDAVIATDAQGRVELLNPVAEALTGWREADAVGQPIGVVFPIVNELTRAEVENPVERVLREGMVVGLANHTVLRARTGAEYPIADSGAPIRNEADQITGVVLVFRDQTAERKATHALEASEVRYRRLFEAAKDGILILDANTGQIMDANPYIADLLGHPREGLLGKHLWEIGLLGDRAEAEAGFSTLQQSGYIRYEDLPLQAADGSIHDVEFVSNVYPIDGTRVIQCNIRDITERKRAEQQAQRWLRLFQVADFGLAHVNALDNTFIEVNPAYARERGYTPEELRGQPIYTLYTPEALAHARERVRDIDSTGNLTFESEHRRKDGTTFPVLQQITTITNTQGRPVSRVVYALDITERKRAEETLRYHAHLLHETGHIAKVGGWEFDAATGKGTWTDEVARIHDLEPGQETNVKLGLSFYTDESRARIEQAIQEATSSAQPYDLELEMITAKGAHKWVRSIGHPQLENGRVTRVYGSFQDITEQRRSADELRRGQERLASLVRVLQYPANDIQALLDFALDQAVELTGSQLGYIYAYNEDARLFTLNTWSRDVMAACMLADPQRTYALDQTGIWGEAVRQRKPIIINDFHAPHPLKRGYPEGHAALHRFATVPVMDGERIVAVVGVANKANEYDGTDVLQLTLLMDAVWKVVEQRRAEEALYTSEHRFRTIMASMRDIVFTLDRDQRHTGVYGPWVEQVGLTPEQFLGKTSIEIMGPEAGQAHVEANLRALEGEFVVYDWSVPTQDGARYYQTSLSPISDEQGRVQGLVGVGRDITDIRRAEAEREKSHQLLTRLAEQVPGVVYQYQLFPDGRSCFPYASPGIWDIYEVTPEEVREDATPVFGRLHPEDYDRISDEIFGSARTQEIFHSEFRVQLPIQGVRWRRCDAKPTLLEDGSTLWHGIISDITDRKQVEAELAESEARYRQLVQSSPYAVVVHQDERVVYVNPAAVRLYGAASANEVVGRHVSEFMTPEGLEEAHGRFRRLLAGESGVYPAEARYHRLDGSEVIVEVTAAPFSYSGRPAVQFLALDVTERRKAEQERDRLQEQLVQAQKMESVGRLAGGVAHDFNNMLSVIIGNADLAMDQTDPHAPLYADLSEIRKAAERSANLTRQLLAFARKQTIAPRVLDLNETISSMLKMLQRLIGEDIDLVWRPGRALWPVKMDPAQVDQILANLAVNARDAIAGVGNLTIETDNVTFDESYCATHAEIVPGEYIMLAVSDTGCGMPKETLQHLFEPFFTTKDVGKGTGLGLATIYGIVRQNNGMVNVYSELGHGTTFRIYFPRVAETVVREAAVSVGKPTGGTETVLIVEDEPAILKLGEAILQRLGYTVLPARTPAEALTLAAEHNGPIQLLVTDVVMPEMNGRDLQVRVTALRPDIKVLYMSGYTANVIAHHGVLDKGVRFMQKPFSVRSLGALVREVLDS